MINTSNNSIRYAIDIAKQRASENNIIRNQTVKEYKAVGLNKEDFKFLFISEAEQIMKQRGVFKPYIIDDINRDVINNMYLYLIGDNRCAWNTNAGIILAGNPGTGKTLILEALIGVHNSLCTRKIKSFHVNDLCTEIKKSGIDKFRFEPLMIDEFGRENVEEKEFGNIIKPMTDLICARYNMGARTFMTTNFPYKVFNEKYGAFITDRLKEMCTFVVLKGESRRVNNGGL